MSGVDPVGVLREMREELATSQHVVEVSVGAFQSWIDRLSAPPHAPAEAVGEYVAGHPKVPGIYRVRGFHIGHPKDFAVVEVIERDGDLLTKLHECNSDRHSWTYVSDCSTKFEWQRVGNGEPPSPAPGVLDDLEAIWYEVCDTREARAAYERLKAAFAPEQAVGDGWRPIESAPKDSQVVLFCDARGNRWTQCADAWDVPVCGLPASFWKPLPAPPPAAATGGQP